MWICVDVSLCAMRTLSHNSFQSIIYWSRCRALWTHHYGETYFISTWFVCQYFKHRRVLFLIWKCSVLKVWRRIFNCGRRWRKLLTLEWNAAWGPRSTWILITAVCETRPSTGVNQRHMWKQETSTSMYSVKLCSDRANAYAKAKIFFDVCHLFFNLFCFRFRSRFRRVWIGP